MALVVFLMKVVRSIPAPEGRPGRPGEEGGSGRTRTGPTDSSGGGSTDGQGGDPNCTGLQWSDRDFSDDETPNPSPF